MIVRMPKTSFALVSSRGRTQVPSGHAIRDHGRMIDRAPASGVRRFDPHLRPAPPALKSNWEQDIEILILRHHGGVLQRQLGDARVRFTPACRALLAVLLRPPSEAGYWFRAAAVPAAAADFNDVARSQPRMRAR